MIASGTSLELQTYHIILHGLCKNHHTDEAMNLFNTISCQKENLEARTFSILIQGMFQAGKVNAARNLFNSILANDVVSPDVLTYTIMMKGLIKEGLLDEFDELFLSLKKMVTLQILLCLSYC
ncbi:protein Rf1, mitochondrial-like isoform X1 [Iris pallida]|uniref:Protein Rf1, mitochondrial-like isoform X1 n=1 Tax=Iris pallida TaxID=29817 RepID=A0AAX6II83_IRIPA|nr:protein Rf1, mitochondrial-like isoform X1 [Iris pallida]